MRTGLACALSASVLLAACGDGPERPLVQPEGGRPILVDVYDDVADCVAARRLGAARCRQGLAEAMAWHPLFAPRMASHDLCLEEHGACLRTGTGEAAWSFPRPVAFLACHPEPGGCTRLYFAPVYESVSFHRFTGQGGGYVGSAPGIGLAGERPRHQVGRIARYLPIV